MRNLGLVQIISMQSGWLDIPAAQTHFWRLRGDAGFDPEFPRFAGQQRKIIIVIISRQNALAGVGVAQVNRTSSAGVFDGLVTSPSTTKPPLSARRATCLSTPPVAASSTVLIDFHRARASKNFRKQFTVSIAQFHFDEMRAAAGQSKGRHPCRHPPPQSKFV